MLTEILRREPTALSWTARAGGFVVPPPTRPHSFSLVVRTCRLVGERGGAFQRIFPALVFLIVVRMQARPAFGHSIKCSPDSPWAIRRICARATADTGTTRYGRVRDDPPGTVLAIWREEKVQWL